jgi:hypothetical protein
MLVNSGQAPDARTIGVMPAQRGELHRRCLVQDQEFSTRLGPGNETGAEPIFIQGNQPEVAV